MYAEDYSMEDEIAGQRCKSIDDYTANDTDVNFNHFIAA